MNIIASSLSIYKPKKCMLTTKIFDVDKKPSAKQKSEIVDFLHDNLQQYGDPKNQIERAIDYSTREIPSFGGFTMLLLEDEAIRGAVVINRTGMGGYIPENILVYIATDKNKRGRGWGKSLLKSALDRAEGDIALHVDADNMARQLYENFGFTTPYLEMRLKR